MRPFDAAVLRCLVFLLRRYAKTGWVPDNEPTHRERPRENDCECEACQLRMALEREGT